MVKRYAHDNDDNCFLAVNGSLGPLIESLCSSNPCEFDFWGFRRNQTNDLRINCPSLWPTEPRLHVRSLMGHGSWQTAAIATSFAWHGPRHFSFLRLRLQAVFLAWQRWPFKAAAPIVERRLSRKHQLEMGSIHRRFPGPEKQQAKRHSGQESWSTQSWCVPSRGPSSCH